MSQTYTCWALLSPVLKTSYLKKAEEYILGLYRMKELLRRAERNATSVEEYENAVRILVSNTNADRIGVSEFIKRYGNDWVQMLDDAPDDVEAFAQKARQFASLFMEPCNYDEYDLNRWVHTVNNRLCVLVVCLDEEGPTFQLCEWANTYGVMDTLGILS